MNEFYFVISNSDGDTSVEELTKNELLKRIDENYWGERIFLDYIPCSDTNYWGDSVLIIKGKMVTPTEKTVVTKYNID